MKKKVIILISILLIMIAGMGIFTFLNNDAPSYNDIIKLADNLVNVNNVILHIENTENNIHSDGGTFYIKNGIETILDMDNSIVEWQDTINDEIIYIDKYSKKIQIRKDKTTSYLYTPYELLEVEMNNNSKYKYIGKEKIDNFECYTIQVKNKDEFYQYSFDINTGLLIKSIIEINADNNEISHIERNYKYTFDVVTDEYVKKIDLKNFSDFEIEYL
ncbi:MAG: hypothetical protein J6A36_02325 [Clostridia bacterium]|nr:hypothetical protein [Clostridia bacterium]